MKIYSAFVVITLCFLGFAHNNADAGVFATNLKFSYRITDQTGEPLRLAQAGDGSTLSGEQLQNMLNWPYNLTSDRIDMLREIGCRFNSNERDAAERLQDRGFGFDQYISAYRNLARLGIPPMKIGRSKLTTYLEDYATANYIGLDSESFREMVSSGIGLTDYYNSRIGGDGMFYTGHVITAIGGVFATFSSLAFSLATVAFFWGFATGEMLDPLFGFLFTLYFSSYGFSSAVVGSVHLAIGLPLLTFGQTEREKRAPENFFETADIRAINNFIKNERFEKAQNSSDPLLARSGANNMSVRVSPFGLLIVF